MPAKVDKLRELLEAERSCVVEHGTEEDMLSDFDLGEYLYLSPLTVYNYRAKIQALSMKQRLQAYRKERDAT